MTRVPHNLPSFIFWQLWSSMWHCDVDHCAVLCHQSPDAGMLMWIRCHSVTDHQTNTYFPLASTTFDDDGPVNLLLTSLWLEQSSCWFPVTLPILWQFTQWVLNHFSLVLFLTFGRSLLFQIMVSATMICPCKSGSYADWINCCDTMVDASDARITRISSQNIHVSS